MSMQKIAKRKPVQKSAKRAVSRSRPKLSAAVSREIDQAVLVADEFLETGKIVLMMPVSVRLVTLGT